MKKTSFDTPELQPLNCTDALRSQLRALMPEAFHEDQLDVNILRQLIGEDAVETEEHYGLNWHGKRNARQLALTPSRGTLRPCKAESVDWDTTQNLMIEGDNLEVLKLLQKSYANKVRFIYIDPPYNTAKDFVYRDDFQDNLKNYLDMTGQSEAGYRNSTRAETGGRLHTQWLDMMYPRLKLARNLLRDDGVIFISIDEIEQANLKLLCDDVFGEDNYVECISWNKRIPQNDKGIGNIHEYVLIYAKNNKHKQEFVMRKEGLSDIYELTDRLKKNGVPLPEAEKEIAKLYKKNGYDRGITLYNNLDFNYQLWGKVNMSWPNANSFGPTYDVLHPITGRPVKVPDRGWRWKKETFDDAAKVVEGRYSEVVELPDGSVMCGRIWFSHKDDMQPSSITFLNDVNYFLLRSVLSLKSDGGIEVENLFDGKGLFSYPKPTSLLQTLISSVKAEDGDIFLDFFAGSGTTGHAVMLNNAESGKKYRYVLVQLPEALSADTKEQKVAADFCAAQGLPATLAELTKARLRRAASKVRAANPGWEGDTGFRVFRLDSSNIRPWQASADSLAAQLAASVNPILDDRNDADLLTELMLKRGIDLSVNLETRQCGGLTVTCVAHGKLFTCFAPLITEEAVEALAAGIVAWHRDLKAGKESQCYFLDDAFESNVAKSNLSAILHQQGLTHLHSL